MPEPRQRETGGTSRRRHLNAREAGELVLTETPRRRPPASAQDAAPAPTKGAGRLPALDGVRGVAALFVVLHHCLLTTYLTTGTDLTAGIGAAPTWTVPLAFGHLAVAVFIVLSGFSLSVGPARKGWQLGGVRRFLRRRAWRILPPYWAALLFSLIVAWTLAAQPGEGTPNTKSVVVFGLLLHDAIGAPSPNGPFWSIAIEAQLYLLLPLLLLVRRRIGPVVALVLVAVPVLAIGVLSPHSASVAFFERFVPQMAVLFALGAIAAAVVTNDAGPRWLRLRRSTAPWGWLAAVAAVPPIALIAAKGVTWTLGNYFWVDLLVGPAVAILIAGLSVGHPAPLVRFLDSRPLRSLGSFSYSLYLVHSPIVVAIGALAIAPLMSPGVPMLLVMLAVAVPASVIFARLFAGVFELPFQRHRSREALLQAARERFGGVGDPSSTQAEPTPFQPGA